MGREGAARSGEFGAGTRRHQPSRRCPPSTQPGWRSPKSTSSRSAPERARDIAGCHPDSFPYARNIVGRSEWLRQGSTSQRVPSIQCLLQRGRSSRDTCALRRRALTSLATPRSALRASILACCSCSGCAVDAWENCVEQARGRYGHLDLDRGGRARWRISLGGGSQLLELGACEDSGGFGYKHGVSRGRVG